MVPANGATCCSQRWRAAYIVGMTNFEESKVRRGQPGNKAQFAEKVNSEPDGSVLSSAPAPATVTVRLYQWVHDFAQYSGEATFDARAILDSKSLADYDPEQSGENDWLFDEAVRLGLAEGHDGPFSVDMTDESISDYEDARRAAGQDGAVTARPRMSRPVVDRKLEELGAQAAWFDRQTVDIAKDGIEDAVLTKFPSATTVGLEDINSDDTGSPYLQVNEIWSGTELLWDIDSNHDWEDVQNLAPLLDRCGLTEFTMPGDANHDRFWNGWKIS